MQWKYLIAASLAMIVAVPACAQQKIDDRFDFQPGDLIQFGEGMYPPAGSIYMVVSCNAAGSEYRECQMKQTSPQPSERAAPFTMYTYRSVMTLVGRGGAAAAPPAAAPAPAPAAPVTPDVPTTTPAPPQTAATGACPRSAYGGPVAGTRAASAALFRQKITDSITMAAYGPYWYGVKLDNFTVGAPVRNTVGMNNTGANRITNGAPVGAMLYPVSTTMSVCEGAPTSSSAWRTSEKKYFCFVSKENEWTCGATN